MKKWTKKELQEMKAMRIKERLTYKELGKRYNLTSQRVQQLISDKSGHLPIKTFVLVCKQCGKKRILPKHKVFLKRKYCSERCFGLARQKYGPKGKPQKEFTEEDWKKRHKERNFTPERIKYRKEYHQKNKEKIKARNKTPKAKAYFSEYYKRPEVKERVNRRNRERYKNDPEFRKSRIESRKKWHKKQHDKNSI